MGFDFFFDLERPFALYLNVGIVGLTAVALVSLARGYFVRLRREWSALKILERSLGDEDLNREKLSTLGTRMHHSTATARRLRDLSNAFRRREQVDADGLVAVAAEEFRSDIAFPRTIAGLLVLLGLAGTLVGLGIGISGLSDLLGREEGGASLALMRDAILDTLSGMTIAFSTTLAGVAGAVVLGLAIGHYRSVQSRLLRTLEHLSTTRIAPLFETSEGALLGEAARELERVGGTLEERLETLAGTLEVRGGQLAAEVGQGLGGLHDVFRKQAAELLEGVAEVRDATLRILGEQKPDSPSLAEYVETVKAATSELERSVEAAAGLIPSLQRSIHEVIAANHRSLLSALEEHTARLEPLLGQQAASADALSEATDQAARQLHQVTQVLEALSETVAASQASWSRLESLVSALGQETRSGIRDGLAGVLSEVERLVKDSADSQRQVLDSISGLEGRLQKTLELLSDEGGRARRSSTELLQQIRVALQDALTDTGRTIAGVQEEGQRQLAEELRKLSLEIREIPGASRLRAPQQREDGDGNGPRPTAR